ncbi:hypothetical protein KP509_04G064400 [Ceratopteris richardii]|uniref:Beta-glucosidase n=1 Tax=Ceratopteris richardii TaxID=49495 RepID=A0A8T2UTF2_CERRI|nr:hypothetical protein KP509_04G064400 [Ceratopteris richardii]
MCSLRLEPWTSASRGQSSTNCPTGRGQLCKQDNSSLHKAKYNVLSFLPVRLQPLAMFSFLALFLPFLYRTSVLSAHSPTATLTNIKRPSFLSRNHISQMVIPSEIRFALEPSPIASCTGQSFNITRRCFPADFTFGTATSAYQVEGAVDQGHRGTSIWDTFSHHLGNVIDLSNADITDDHYNRFREDLDLMAEMGVDAYRFSISWSRIFPNASKQVNEVGIDHYNHVIDALLQKGIEPYVTLYHWDLPQALQDKYGGWLSENIIDDFLLFSDTCFHAFGDRVKKWITINEPYSFASQGYSGFGTHAPGRCSFRAKCREGDSNVEPYIVGHNVLLAHASAVALYKAKYQAPQHGLIGITLDSRWYEPLNEASVDDKEASRRALDFHLGWFLGPLVFGDYPTSMKNFVGNRLPTFQKGNTKRQVSVNGSFDFIGLNHYTTAYVRPGRSSYIIASLHNINPDGYFQVSYKRNGKSIGPQSPGAEWLYVVPWGFKNLLDYIRIQYNNPLLIITENGMDQMSRDTLFGPCLTIGNGEWVLLQGLVYTLLIM